MTVQEMTDEIERIGEEIEQLEREVERQEFERTKGICKSCNKERALDEGGYCWDC